MEPESKLLSEVVWQARQVFGCSGRAELRRLQIEIDRQRLIIRGTVGSFYVKQLAQELLRPTVEGVELHNAVEVVYQDTDVADYAY